MNVFVARQPIFNRGEQSVAYELLYRKSEVNSYTHIDGDEATADVIINGFFNIGVEELSEGKKCFINFTENLLNLKLPTYFEPESIVVEILEDIPINKELVSICQELKELGYTIALDDFAIQESYELLPELLKYIDIIKIDFLQTSLYDRRRMITRYKSHQVSFLAEKVETREEFELALKDGFDLFQGYFFSKPDVLSAQDIPAYFQTHYQISEELSKQEPNINDIASKIEQDVALSYKLLRLINTAAFFTRNKINSIKHALVFIGLKEFKKWIYVLTIKQIDHEKNTGQEEVIKLSLIRAHLCEQLSQKIGKNDPSPYLLAGMFSLIDNLLHCSIDDALQKLPLSDEIKDAINGTDNEIGKVLNWTIQIEKCNWNLSDLPLTTNEISECYRNAIQWSNLLLYDKSGN
ncbi:MAG TPA: HDOD domain-containing protein [Bacillus sp. (in: firmicutes)]